MLVPVACNARSWSRKNCSYKWGIMAAFKGMVFYSKWWKWEWKHLKKAIRLLVSHALQLGESLCAPSLSFLLLFSSPLRWSQLSSSPKSTRRSRMPSWIRRCGWRSTAWASIMPGTKRIASITMVRHLLAVLSNLSSFYLLLIHPYSKCLPGSGSNHLLSYECYIWYFYEKTLFLESGVGVGGDKVVQSGGVGGWLSGLSHSACAQMITSSNPGLGRTVTCHKASDPQLQCCMPCTVTLKLWKEKWGWWREASQCTCTHANKTCLLLNTTGSWVKTWFALRNN